MEGVLGEGVGGVGVRVRTDIVIDVIKGGTVLDIRKPYANAE